MSDATTSHRSRAAEHEPARSTRCAVLTVSDSRTADSDESGALIASLLGEAGHVVAERVIVRDEPAAIRARIEQWVRDPSVSVVLTTGGTGIGRRDSTIEVVRSMLAAELEGFGELFRAISYEEIGPAAMLSRATAGLVASEERDAGETFVFAMPGSVNAVATAMRKLILPELPHVLWVRSGEAPA